MQNVEVDLTLSKMMRKREKYIAQQYKNIICGGKTLEYIVSVFVFIIVLSRSIAQLIS